MAKPNIKAVGKKFILQLLEQCFTHKQNSQALNLHLTAIDKIVTQMEDEMGTVV